MVTAKNREMFEINARLDLGRDGVEKIIAVLLRLKAHDIGAEHSLENFLAPRADRKLGGGWPWYVPKDRDLRIGAALFDHGGHQREVVILYKYERPFDAANFVENRFGEEAVDFAILRPVFFAEYRPHVRHVAQRPQRLVGKAVVVSFHFFAREPDALERVLRLIVRDTYFVVRVDEELVGLARSVCDPHAAGRLHHGLKRRHDTACGHRPFNAALAARVDVWLAGGYDKNRSIFHMRLDKFFETLGRPRRVEFFEPHARLLTCRKARPPKATR